MMIAFIWLKIGRGNAPVKFLSLAKKKLPKKILLLHFLSNFFDAELFDNGLYKDLSLTSH